MTVPSESDAVAVMAYIGFITWGIFGAVVAGLLAGVVIGQATEYFTSDEYAPTRGIAGQGMQSLSLYYNTPESREGVAAFNEKRKPDFRKFAK